MRYPLRSCKPLIVTIALSSTVFFPANKINSQAIQSQVFGRALTSGQIDGYSQVNSTIKTPDPYLVGGEYAYGYTEIYDSRTSPFMAVGPTKYCYAGTKNCVYHPLIAYQDISGYGTNFLDTTIPLGANYNL